MTTPTSTTTNAFMSASNADKAILAQRFKDAVQDANGQDVYSNVKVHLGYLDPKMKMLIPKTYWDDIRVGSVLHYVFPVDLTILGRVNGVLEFTGDVGETHKKSMPFMTKTAVVSTDVDVANNFWIIAIMNFVGLSAAGVDSNKAVYAALFRARWATTGGLAYLIKSKTGAKDEVTLVEESDSEYGHLFKCTDVTRMLSSKNFDLSAMVEVMMDDKGGIKWVVKHSENIWCAVEHAFRVRGHHFKTTGTDADSYASLYDKYLNACFEGDFVPPEGFDWFTIAHTAIHPFKIEALPKTAAHFVAHGLVADAALIRFNGAPVGNAMITTTCAAMDTMAAEVWYGAFESRYGTAIFFLNECTKAITGNKYQYHIAAGLYGMAKISTIMVDGEIYTVERAKSKVAMLGAAASGLIDALFEIKEGMKSFTFALSNAKSLKKAAEQNPLLSIRVKELIVKSMESILDSTTMNAAISAALPDMPNDANPTSTAIVPSNP